MIRNLFLAAVVCGGFAAQAAALPPFPTHHVPLPPPSVGTVEGQWFYQGDPRAPCFIERVSGDRGPMLMLTNEKGEKSRGEVVRGGAQVIAYDWGPGGWLVGDVQGNAIYWQNGTQWFR